MKLFNQSKTDPLYRKPAGKGKMTVEYTPGSEHPYSLLDENGKVLVNASPRRDLVAMMESGHIPTSSRGPQGSAKKPKPQSKGS